MTDVDPTIDDSVRLTWDRGRATLHVAGFDLAPVARSADIHVDADGVPRVVLELDTLALDVSATDAGVVLGEVTTALLERLGWTPPEVTRAEVERLRLLVDGPIVRRADDGTVTCDWPEGATSAVIARELLDTSVEERNRLVRQVNADSDAIRQLEQEAERRGVEIERLHGNLDLRDGELAHANAQRDQARAEVEKLRGRLEAREHVLTAERDAARRNLGIEVTRAVHAEAEVERLRGLLVEALDGWKSRSEIYCADVHSRHDDSCIDPRVAEIRREAGLE